MDSPATPAHIGRREARREIQRTHMLPLHGSEELATRGDIQRSPSVDDGSASMLNCTITGDGSPASANQPSEPASPERCYKAATGHHSSSPAEAEQGIRNEAGYTTWPITSWNWSFLEAKSITPAGMKLIMEDQCNGNTLLGIVGDDEVHDLLRENGIAKLASRHSELHDSLRENGIAKMASRHSQVKRIAIITTVMKAKGSQPAGDSCHTHSTGKPPGQERTSAQG